MPRSQISGVLWEAGTVAKAWQCGMMKFALKEELTVGATCERHVDNNTNHMSQRVSLFGVLYFDFDVHVEKLGRSSWSRVSLPTCCQ